MATALPLLYPTALFCSPKPQNALSSSSPLRLSLKPLKTPQKFSRRRGKQFLPKADDFDFDLDSPFDSIVEDQEFEEMDNKKDIDHDYGFSSSFGVSGEDIAMVDSDSFISTQGQEAEKLVNYRINEEEFHKISLLDCDFFIRKPPDPDDSVYDFREMYVTPPDTDVYSIPKVLAPMPQKYIRCSQSDFGRYNVTEPPIDAPRDPMFKSEREIFKVFLFKHYRNRRLADPEFMLDFEEIYVIDSKTKSITRAKVVVTVPAGRNRDRKRDLLSVCDNGSSFKILDLSEREDADTFLQKREWEQSRGEMERYLRKLRDYGKSNWF
ncbi:PLASTID TRANSCRIPTIONALLY ACTIVE protein 6, chloroplastic [Turnera subulata]|uniref:PLASTID TRANSCRIPTIONALLY ACTIVE protein 6, chloroplastic n=1 Tax=Turnera subulata TaxID=218843 RepID=A0A9Q0FT44_9ROSI|nr:PLASTID TRANSCRIPTIONALLY ACTIVE protein 6, chloroplastic [Turnera subulata]